MRRDVETALMVEDSMAMLGPNPFDAEDSAPAAGGIRRIEDLPNIASWAAQRVEYANEGLIVRNGLNLVTGKAGAGKSMLATALMAACAKGENFLGRKTERMKVLLLDRENPAGVVAERFELFGMPNNGVYAWGAWLPDEPPMPDSHLVLDFGRRNPALVVIDTLIRFHGGEESSASDTAAFMARCRKLAATGAAVVLLHHTGKGATSSDYRGSSDIAGAVDTAYALEATEGAKGLDSLKLRCFKFRVGEAPEPLHLKLDDGRFVITSDPSADAHRSKFAAAIEIVRNEPGISTARLIEGIRRTGAGRNEAERIIRAAVDAGDIRKIADDRGGFRFTIAGALELSL